MASPMVCDPHPQSIRFDVSITVFPSILSRLLLTGCSAHKANQGDDWEGPQLQEEIPDEFMMAAPSIVTFVCGYYSRLRRE